jgi:hypothetical protein
MKLCLAECHPTSVAPVLQVLLVRVSGPLPRRCSIPLSLAAWLPGSPFCLTPQTLAPGPRARKGFVTTVT